MQDQSPMQDTNPARDQDPVRDTNPAWDENPMQDQNPTPDQKAMPDQGPTQDENPVQDEVVLPGGHASGVVVRVGDTIRKAATASTSFVTLFMDAIRAHGVDVPRRHGYDESGRVIQEYVPGRLAMDVTPLSDADLRRAGTLVRTIHDAASTFAAPPGAVWETAIPAPGADLVCHNDLAPWNLVVGERWTFIDWDAAAPSTRLWDLAYAVHAFALSDTHRPPQVAARRVAAFVDGYDADRQLRADLPAAMVRRTAAMYELLRDSHTTGVEPWSTMFREGHGDHWSRALEYVREHESVWRRALDSST